MTIGPKKPGRSVPWLLLPALVAIVALVYQPAWAGGVLWDDARHLTAPSLQSLHGLWRIWAELGATQQYYPVVHSAFWIEHRLWSDALPAYHFVNIVLHAISAFLLAIVLRRLRIPGATAAAIVFAVHPVNVESVAWMSEQKNTLSTFFYLAAALVYLRFDERRTRGDYAAALALFVLALLSKTVTATLPFSLLIVLWWRRGHVAWRRDILPLAPFVAAGAAAGILTTWVERQYIGAAGAEFSLTIAERVLVAGRAIWFYLGKLAWPAGLAFSYPRWNPDPAAWQQWLYPVAVMAAIAVLWSLRHRTRAPLAALLLFIVAAAPALGFVNVFPFRYSFVADHFEYLATVPAIAFACAALADAVRLRTASRFVAASGALLLAVPLAALANGHARDFAGAEPLYRATLERNPDSWMAHNNLAMILMADGRTEEARDQFIEALRIDPGVAETQMNAGRVLIEEHQLPEAIAHLREAIRLGADPADAHSNIGVAMLRRGDASGALAEFEEALRTSPAHPQARANLAAAHEQLGVADAQAGRLVQATAHFELAVRFAPDEAASRCNLGMAYLATGRPQDAIGQLREALRLAPGLAQARAGLAAAEQAVGTAATR